LAREVDNAARRLDKAKATFRKGTSRDQYMRTAGEIEARDVQARMNFTPAQRAAVAPYSSQNVSEEDAIVMFAPRFSLSVNHRPVAGSVRMTNASLVRGEIVGQKAPLPESTEGYVPAAMSENGVFVDDEPVISMRDVVIHNGRPYVKDPITGYVPEKYAVRDVPQGMQPRKPQTGYYGLPVPPPEFARGVDVEFVDDIRVGGAKRSAMVFRNRVYLNASTVKSREQMFSALGHEGMHVLLMNDNHAQAVAEAVVYGMTTPLRNVVEAKLRNFYDSNTINEELQVHVFQTIWDANPKLHTLMGRTMQRVKDFFQGLFGKDVSESQAKVQATALFARAIKVAQSRKFDVPEFRFMTAPDSLRDYRPAGSTPEDNALMRLVRDLRRLTSHKKFQDNGFTERIEAAMKAPTAETLAAIRADIHAEMNERLGLGLSPNSAVLRQSTDGVLKLVNSGPEEEKKLPVKQLEEFYALRASMLVGKKLDPQIKQGLLAHYKVNALAEDEKKVFFVRYEDGYHLPVAEDLRTLLLDGVQADGTVMPLLHDDLKTINAALKEFPMSYTLRGIGPVVDKIRAAKALEPVQAMTPDERMFGKRGTNMARSFLRLFTDATILPRLLAKSEKMRTWLESVVLGFISPIQNEFHRAVNAFTEMHHEWVSSIFGMPSLPRGRTIAEDSDFRIWVAAFMRQSKADSSEPDVDLENNYKKLRQSWENVRKLAPNNEKTDADVKAKIAVLDDLMKGIPLGEEGAMEALRDKINTGWLNKKELGYLNKVTDFFEKHQPVVKYAYESLTGKKFQTYELYTPIMAVGAQDGHKRGPSLGTSQDFAASTGVDNTASTDETAPLMDRSEKLTNSRVYYSDSFVHSVNTMTRFLMADVHVAPSRNATLALLGDSLGGAKTNPIRTQLVKLLSGGDGPVSSGVVSVVDELHTRLMNASTSVLISSRSLYPWERWLNAITHSQASVALSSVRHVLAQPAQAVTSFLVKHAASGAAGTSALTRAFRIMFAEEGSADAKGRKQVFDTFLYHIQNRVMTVQGIDSSSYKDQFGHGNDVRDAVNNAIVSVANATGTDIEKANKFIGALEKLGEGKDKILGFWLKKGDGLSAQMIALAELIIQWENANKRVFTENDWGNISDEVKNRTMAELNVSIGPSDRSSNGLYFMDHVAGARITRNIASIFAKFTTTAVVQTRASYIKIRDLMDGGKKITDPEVQAEVGRFMAGVAGNMSFGIVSFGVAAAIGAVVSALRGDDEDEEALLEAYAERSRLRGKEVPDELQAKIKELEAKNRLAQRTARSRSMEALAVKIGGTGIQSLLVLPSAFSGLWSVTGHVLVDAPREALFRSSLEAEKELVRERLEKAKKAGHHNAVAEQQLLMLHLNRINVIKVGGYHDAVLGDGEKVIGAGAYAMAFDRITAPFAPFWFDSPGKETEVSVWDYYAFLNAAGYGQADITTILNQVREYQAAKKDE
jgi:hypothetical protein